jgi:DNA-binding transcriptional ArsR family regulator
VSVTIDITGLAPERIVFDISPLAELGVALHALSEPGHHPGLHGWATATAAGLKPDLADRLHEADFLWRSTFSDIFLPFAGLPAQPGRIGASLKEELDLLDRLDDERFVSSALEFTCAGTYSTGAPSPLVDASRRAHALDLAANRGPRQLDFTRRLLADPASVRAWLRRLFEDCDDAFFADTWGRVSTQLAADARHKTELMRRKGLAEALRAVSPALSLDEGGTVISADKLADGRTSATDPAFGAGLTLLPSSFGWPHLMVVHAPGWQPVIQYPIGAPELPGAASVELLKLRMDALAHPMRMRLSRNLGRAAYTTSELADSLGISAPEVSRHLAVLKKAKLISTRRRGRYVLHQLDVTAVARLGSDFLETVLR